MGSLYERVRPAELIDIDIGSKSSSQSLFHTQKTVPKYVQIRLFKRTTQLLIFIDIKQQLTSCTTFHDFYSQINSPNLNAIEAARFWFKRRTAQNGAPTTKKAMEKVWNEA